MSLLDQWSPLRLRLRADWRLLVRRAWSLRLMLLAGALSFADVACTVLAPTFHSVWFALVAGFVAMAAFIARLLAQKNLGVSE